MHRRPSQHRAEGSERLLAAGGRGHHAGLRLRRCGRRCDEEISEASLLVSLDRRRVLLSVAASESLIRLPLLAAPSAFPSAEPRTGEALGMAHVDDGMALRAVPVHVKGSGALCAVERTRNFLVQASRFCPLPGRRGSHRDATADAMADKDYDSISMQTPDSSHSRSLRVSAHAVLSVFITLSMPGASGGTLAPQQNIFCEANG